MEPTQDPNATLGTALSSAQREDRAYRNEDAMLAKAPQSRVNSASENALSALLQLRELVNILDKRTIPVRSNLKGTAETGKDITGGSEVASNFQRIELMAQEISVQVESILDGLEI